MKPLMKVLARILARILTSSPAFYSRGGDVRCCTFPMARPLHYFMPFSVSSRDPRYLNFSIPLGPLF